MFEEEVEIESYDNIQAALRINKQEELNTEIITFAAMFSGKHFEIPNLSSNNFWKEKKLKFPHLSTLFLIFNSINASSAFIERFFSICGIISTQRNQNSHEDLFIARVMLCSNINLVSNLKTKVKK